MSKIAKLVSSVLSIPTFRLPIIIFLTAFICLVLLSPDVHSAQVTLGWDANTESSIAGYRIYYGTASRVYSNIIDVGNQTWGKVSGLGEGVNYYFAATAYDFDGNESNFSDEIAYTTPIPPIPSPPDVATLIYPYGTIDTHTPTYTWNAVFGSTWYYLWIEDDRGATIDQWYTASDTRCPSGTGICSVTPSTPVSEGATWWIQTWNSVGPGPWSQGMNFTVSLP